MRDTWRFWQQRKGKLPRKRNSMPLNSSLINEERSSSNKLEEDERSSVMSRLSTKAWIQEQQQGKTQLEFKRLAANNLGVRMRTEKPRMMNVELSHTDNHLHTKSQTPEFHDNLGTILQESTAAKKNWLESSANNRETIDTTQPFKRHTHV